MAEFTKVRLPAASKRYGCDWCGCGIQRGERHAYLVGKVEGQLAYCRYHLDCLRSLHPELLAKAPFQRTITVD